MTDPQTAFGDRFTLLCHQFAQRTLGEAGEMETLATLLDGPEHQRAATDIRAIVHRLSGGASIFGLEQLSEPAAHIEAMIESGTAVGELQAHVGLLTQTIKRAIADV